MDVSYKQLKIPTQLSELSSVDAAGLKLILTGQSAIDWPWLEFTTEEEMDWFIRVQEFDLNREEDLSHIKMLHREAVIYLSDVLQYRLPDILTKTDDIRKLLLLASQKKGVTKNRTYACMTLKVMHILHHLLARELLFNTALSEAQLADMLTQKVFTSIDRIRQSGVQIVEYAGGRKTRHSLVTKLLAKRETIASQIFDKTRFRIVVKNETDLIPTLVAMNRYLLPFNYAIPGQAENSLLDLDKLATHPEITPSVRDVLDHLGPNQPQKQNEFSGNSYRAINFVVDIPIRIESYLKGFHPPLDPKLGQIVFILAEFQLVDERTAQHNEQGNNNHIHYKARQEERVRQRLEQVPVFR